MNQFTNQFTNYPMQYTNQFTNRTSNGILWVQGIEGAKAYQMPPNGILLLMDSENDGVFYIKSTDNIGMSNLRTFKYNEVKTSEVGGVPDLSEYVKKDELQDLINSMIGGNREQPIQSALQERTVNTNGKHQKHD